MTHFNQQSFYLIVFQSFIIYFHMEGVGKIQSNAYYKMRVNDVVEFRNKIYLQYQQNSEDRNFNGFRMRSEN